MPNLFWGIYEYVSFLDTEMAQVIDTLPPGRQGPVYPTQSIPWLLVAWQRKEPGSRLNIKTVLPMYEDSHVKDKTVVRPSNL